MARAPKFEKRSHHVVPRLGKSSLINGPRGSDNPVPLQLLLASIAEDG